MASAQTATPSTMQKMAAEIFSDMVMQEAINDKTIQVKEQIKDQEGQYHDVSAKSDLLHHHKHGHEEDEEDEDEFGDDEEEKIMRDIRERRMMEMKNVYQEKQENLIKGHGKYTEITEEEFLPNVTGSKFVLCHFYHQDFERCKIMDMHLRKIAAQHTEAKFVTLNAEKAPFFIKKLQIQVLPTVLCFIDGIAVDRVVGFGDMGNKDDFQTLALTRRLIKSGVLKALNKNECGHIKVKRGKDSDDDSDIDDDQ